MASQQLKVSSFYGSAVARPYLLFSDKGEQVEDRVNKPRVNDALIEWGSKVPFESGGMVAKPAEWQGSKPSKARSDFAIFEEERRADILAASAGLMGSAAGQDFRLAASQFWQTDLTEAERQGYRARAAEERVAARDTTAQLQDSDPAYAKHAAAEARYKNAKSAVGKAARDAGAPLWRAQRFLTAKLRAAEAGEAQEQPASTTHKAAKKTLTGRNTVPAAKAKPTKLAAGKKTRRVRKGPTKRIPIRSKEYRGIHAERSAAADAAAQSSPAQQAEQAGPSTERRKAASGSQAMFTGDFELPEEVAHEEGQAQRVTRAAKRTTTAAAAAAAEGKEKTRRRRK